MERFTFNKIQMKSLDRVASGPGDPGILEKPLNFSFGPGKGP